MLNSPDRMGWIVFLHGGPHEQITTDYRKHYSYFLKAGYGIISLNYPGSTGLGKRYEMIDRPDLVEVEFETIKQDIKQIKTKSPIIDEYAMIGVSYSTLLTHLYSIEAKDVSHLIDISGIGAFPSRNDIPVLYIYGEHDFAMKDSDRNMMINNDLNKGNGNVFKVDAEGHSIMRRKNTEAYLRKIVDFLNH